MPRYGIEWARGVLNLYCEMHPRATEAVFEVGGFPADHIAQELAKGSPVWEEFKRVVKSIDPLVKDRALPLQQRLDSITVGEIHRLAVILDTVDTSRLLDRLGKL